MENKVPMLTTAMITLYSNDPVRIHHFMKVYSFAKSIAENEQLGVNMRQCIEAAALVHDIGIHAAEKKYKSTAGSYQEKEGPPIARAMLMTIGFPPRIVERVCFLVGHHHTLNEIDGIDYQILIEADFLVNALEEHMSTKAIKNFRDNYFKTETGINYLNEMYNLD